MKAMHRIFTPTVMSVALMTVFGPAWAQDEATVDELTKPDSSVSVGAGYWSDDRPHEGRYDAMRDKGTYGLFDADINKRDDATGTWLKLNARNLGLDNRELRGEYNRQGNYGGFLEYNKTTYDNPNTFTSGTQGIGTTQLTVGRTGAGGTFQPTDVTLGTQREMWRLGGYTNILPGLDFKVDFKNETKTGTRQTGWGSAALFSVEPVDSTIRELNTILQYTNDKLQLSGGYVGSWYDNDHPLILETVFGAGAGSASAPGTTPLSQPLSNQAHQAFLDGGYAFTPTTRGTMKLAYTHATQDEHLPTYDLATPNNPGVGVPSHLGGVVDTTLVQFGINSRPMPKLTITGNVRYYDVNDKTPLQMLVTGASPVFNTPQSFTTKSGKLEATYRLPMNYSVDGGVEYSSQDRSAPAVGNTAVVGTVWVPFRTDMRETTYKVALRRSLGDSLNGSLGYLHSDRDGNTQNATTGGTPLSGQINPLNVADRKRDKVRAKLDWDPLESVSMQFRIDHSQDNYPSNGQPYGLQDGSANTYAVDASYIISENWKLAAWYSYDVSKATQFNSNNNSVTLGGRTTHIEDTGDSFGASLRGKLTPRIDGGIGFDWFRSTSDYPQDGPGAVLANGFTAPSEVKNNLTRLKLDGTYKVDKKSEVRADLIYERWHSDDPTWSFANGSPFSYNAGVSGFAAGGVTANDGTVVTQQGTQTSYFVGVRYIYKFQ